MDENLKIKFETLSLLFKHLNEAQDSLVEELDKDVRNKNLVSTFTKQVTFHLKKFRKSYETLSEDEKLKFHEFLKKRTKNNL